MAPGPLGKDLGMGHRHIPVPCPPTRQDLLHRRRGQRQRALPLRQRPWCALDMAANAVAKIVGLIGDQMAASQNDPAMAHGLEKVAHQGESPDI